MPPRPRWRSISYLPTREPGISGPPPGAAVMLTPAIEAIGVWRPPARGVCGIGLWYDAAGVPAGVPVPGASSVGASPATLVGAWGVCAATACVGTWWRGTD